MVTRWMVAAAMMSCASAAAAQLVSAQIDYLPAALLAHVEGVVGYQVKLTPAGTVSKCRVLSSSGSKELDAATCDQLRKTGRFRPGTDAAGQPVASTYAGNMRWALTHP